jgi:hypothetical protein
VLGQLLYLEAEPAGVRGTSIGCCFDDVFHERLGLSGDEFQDPYHFHRRRSGGRPSPDLTTAVRAPQALTTLRDCSTAGPPLDEEHHEAQDQRTLGLPNYGPKTIIVLSVTMCK